MKNQAIFLSIIACLSGCQPSSKYMETGTLVPEKWKHSENPNKSIPNVTNWWEVFEDEKLNEIECQALRNNKDIYIAFERILQAKALAGIAKSETYPQLDLEPFYTNEGILWMKFAPTRILREHRRRNQIPFVLNYELDLWGKLEKTYQAAFLTLEAEKQAFNTSILILTTDLASSYFQIRTLDADIYFLNKILQSRKRALEILKSRYEAKIINYSDVSRAEYEYKYTQAMYFNSLKLRNLEENKIAVLLGMPASDFKIETLPLNQSPPIIPPGLPSDILHQRPDIAQAEFIMASENAMIGVAYASFFPSFSLTGALGFSSPELRDFLSWKSRLWRIGADVFQPIFDAGRLRSNLNFAKSKFREANDAYQQQVLIAFQEVEDALTNLEGLTNEYESLSQAVLAANKTYEIAFDRYIKGITFYLDVVDSERQALDAERDLIDLLGQQYAATIQLIKSLGGSWTTECNINSNFYE
jgi:multidrug efflux system outer membrane protein